MTRVSSLQNVWSRMVCSMLLNQVHHTIAVQMAASGLIPLAERGWRPRASRLPSFGDSITTYAMSTPRSRMMQSDDQSSSVPARGPGLPRGGIYTCDASYSY